MKLPPADLRRPSFLYNNRPTVKRPDFDKRAPNEHNKRVSVIRGAGANRCMFCAALMPYNDEQCGACGRTQIDPSILEGGELWKKRIKFLGTPKKGYTGA